MQPTDTLQLTATYLPIVGGTASGTLAVVSDAVTRPHDEADFTGQGDAPRLCIAAADSRLGDVSVNTTATKTAQLQNCGLEPLTITALTPGAPQFALAATAPALPDHRRRGRAAGRLHLPPHRARAGLAAIGCREQRSAPASFTQQGNGVQCTLDVQPGTLAFGSVSTSSSASQTFTLFSIGTSDCTVTALTGPAAGSGFTMPTPPQLPLDLPAGNAMEIEVDFVPPAVGAANGSIVIASNDAVAPSQTLLCSTATGVTPPPCDFQAAPASVAFGAVAIGQSATTNVVVTNHGTDECYITGGGPSGSTAFTATMPASFPPPTIASGSSLTIPVKFTPTSAAAQTGALALKYANQPVSLTSSTLTVPLSGGALTPQLCLVPTSLDFGSVAAGASASKSFSLQSCGQGALTVRGLLLGPGSSADFTLQAPPAVPFTLAPGNGTTITVVFKPSNTSGSAGNVEVLSDDPQTPAGLVSLRGNLGACATQLSCSPGTVAFPGTPVGRTAVKPSNCINAGQSAVTITGVAIAAGSDGDLSLLAGQFPQTLQPHGVLRTQVQFAPTSTAAGTATFTLQTGGCGDAQIVATAKGDTPTLPACPAITTFTPQTKWAWNGSPQASDSNNLIMTPAVVPLTDTNGDGQIDENDVPSIVFTSCSDANCCVDCLDVQNMQNADLSGIGILHAVSGADGSDEWALTAANLAVPAGSQIAVGDLDGDGIPEIIAVQHSFRAGVACPGVPESPPLCGKYVSGNLMVLDNHGNLKFFTEPWTQPIDVTGNYSAPLIADLNQDGSPEIIYGDTVFDSTGHVLWHMSAKIGDNGQGVFPAAADLNGDGMLEVIGGPSAYLPDGGVLWTASGIADGFAMVADIDGDGKPEVIERPDSTHVIVLNGATGQTVNTITFPSGAPSGVADSVCPGGTTAADFLGLGFMQLGVPSGNWFYLVRGDTGAILWQQPTNDYQGQCGASGAAAFSFFGDGKTDVVYHDATSVYVWRGDGTQVYQAPRVSSTLFETPVIADVDHTGHADIVITNQGAGGTNNGLTVLSDSGDSWPDTRGIWGQWNYHVTDYNSNGTIPRVEAPFWETTKLWRGNPALCTP